jgi:hypothetical protein
MRQVHRSALSAVRGSGLAPIAPGQLQRRDTPSQTARRPRFRRSKAHGARMGRCPCLLGQVTDQPGWCRRCRKPARLFPLILRLHIRHRIRLHMSIPPSRERCAVFLPARMTGHHSRRPRCRAASLDRPRYGPQGVRERGQRIRRRSHASARVTLVKCRLTPSAMPWRLGGRMHRRRRTHLVCQAS